MLSEVSFFAPPLDWRRALHHHLNIMYALEKKSYYICGALFMSIITQV